MTYKEFIEWVKNENSDWRIEEDGFDLTVIEEEYELVDIDKKNHEELVVMSDHIQLIEKALELAKTPLEEREEQKRYYVVLKGVDQNFGYVNEDEGIGDLFMNSKKETDCEKTKFTKQEAEEIMKRLSFEMVEVEDE